MKCYVLVREHSGDFNGVVGVALDDAGLERMVAEDWHRRNSGFERFTLAELDVPTVLPYYRRWGHKLTTYTAHQAELQQQEESQ